MIRFEIKTKDRIGITTEILCKIYNRGIDLVSMEVFPKKVYIKILYKSIYKFIIVCI